MKPQISPRKDLIAYGSFLAFLNGYSFGLTPKGVISIPATFFHATALIKTTKDILNNKSLDVSKKTYSIALVTILTIGSWIALVFFTSPLVKRSPLFASLVMFSWGGLCIYLGSRRMEYYSYNDPKSNNKTISDLQLISGFAYCISSISLLALRIIKTFC